MSREDARVPALEAWQRAADEGVSGRAALQSADTRPAPAPTPASVPLPADLREALIHWCRLGLPNEACGLLVGARPAREGGSATRFVGMRNAAASPYRYLIDPDEQLRVMLEMDDADEVVWAIVHSHVGSPAVPSATDIGLAAYPDALYLICSFASDPPHVRGWSIRDGDVEEVGLDSA